MDAGFGGGLLQFRLDMPGLILAMLHPGEGEGGAIIQNTS
jgi:hypothetical protein